MATLLAVEGPVHYRGDGLDLSAQLLLNAIEVQAVVVGDEIDGETQVTKTSGSTNAVEIRLRVLGKVKVDDHIDGRDVNTTSEEIR